SHKVESRLERHPNKNDHYRGLLSVGAYNRESQSSLSLTLPLVRCAAPLKGMPVRSLWPAHSPNNMPNPRSEGAVRQGSAAAASMPSNSQALLSTLGETIRKMAAFEHSDTMRG